MKSISRPITQLTAITTLILLAVIPVLVSVSQANHALARNGSQGAAPGQQQSTTSRVNVLSVDGTLNMQDKFSSLVPKGWSTVNEPGNTPRFEPSETTSEKPKSPRVAGDARWDDRFVLPGTDNTILAIVRSGNGDIYVAGTFTMAGGVPANRIARWNGNAWSALGSGANSTVYTLTIIGNDVYAGGLFTIAGGVTVNHVAKWNGSTWSALGAGTDDRVYAIAVNNNGDIYVGGDFTTAGGIAANHVARWDGTAWFALGSGTNAVVNAITPLVENGSLFVGGAFTTAGGSTASRIA
ncbi:MAG: hypothetical protein M3014_10805, partial [Chloroflexota bacterium]|nr:hypothetical protein [Chloroflexota bacterium]